MHIDAITENSQNLVNAIDKSIKDKILKTWKKVSDSKGETLYSHTPDQWDEKAMLKPYVQKGKVHFVISWWSKNGEPANDVKGYVLGRFVEALMVHFGTYFTHLEIKQ